METLIMQTKQVRATPFAKFRFIT